MKKTSEQFKEILEFREKKSQELNRTISFSEAIALWFSESFNRKVNRSSKKALIR